jgi:hypothetical protein
MKIALKTSVLRSPLLLALVCLISASGCESLLPLSWVQGAGDNLHPISDFQEQSFTATTGVKRFKGQTSRADELIVLDGFDKLNNLDAVELSFPEGLFAGIDISDFVFYGRAEHTYTFRYDFTDYYVILSKVAAAKDIPSQELTYAQALGDGQFKVPMMGLPISLFTVETVRDERGKETRKQTTYAKEYLKEATHFRTDREGVTYFETTGKQDLLPVDYFNPEDEWFFTKTLVGRPINSQDILGSQVQALKIKFARTNNSVIGVDLNIAPEQQKLDPTKTITALEFPAEWVDFRLEKSGRKALLKETKLGDKEPTSKFWKERKYALMDFNNADRLDRAFTLDNKLEKLEIGSDYLSFNIYESSTGNTYKYSLAKENRRIPGQIFHAEDASLFHIFTERKKVINSTLFTQTPDIDKIVFANRFYPDPEKKEIAYYLSHNSPDVPEFEEAVRTAITAWDSAFQQAGSDIRVRFDPRRVELGDVRYNQIVLYGYEIDSSLASGGTLLGFGPSLQDTRSGQTFSANTHIYLRAYREGLLSSIRSFVRAELGLYADKKVMSVPSFAYADSLETLTPPVQASGGMTGLVHLTNFLRSPTLFTDTLQRENFVESVMPSDEAKRRLEELSAASQVKVAQRDGECGHSDVAARSTAWKKIRATCLLPGNAFNKYMTDLRGANQANPAVQNLSNEEEAVLACAQPLMKDLLISTLTHEIGHNLGLGHNFAASSDGANYAKRADGTIAYPSSSVMDYPDRDYDVFSKAGPYDVASIRYLYGRKVETKTAAMISIPEGQSAVETARKAAVELKQYRMCTDYEAMSNNLPDFDPLCSRWDVGTNPREYVLWATRKIHADIIENGYRYNNVRFGGARAGLNYFLNFKQIHDYFRYLVVKQTGLHFEKMSAVSEPAMLQAISMSSNPALTLQYYEAVKEIFAFSREILNMSSRICVSDVSGQIKGMVEFKDLRNRIFEKHQKTVQNCVEAQALGLPILATLGHTWATTPNVKLLDRGVELAGYEMDLDPNAPATVAKQTSHNGGYWDLRFSSGVAALKSAALMTMVSRGDDWKNTAGARIAVLRTTEAAGVRGVSFVDFPWFADKLFNDAVNRVALGMEQKYVDPSLTGTVPFFREYEEFNYVLLRSLMTGGLDQRSPAYEYSLSIRPNKEASQTTFTTRYGTSEEPIWHVTNTLSQVLYSSSNTLSGRLLRVLIEANQVVAVYYLTQNLNAAAATANIQTRLDAVNPALAVEERLFQASLAYFTNQPQRLTLQPAQKGMLRTALKAALVTATPAELDPAGQAAFLKLHLSSFVKNVITNPMVMGLATKDADNYSALVNTLNAYMTSF